MVVKPDDNPNRIQDHYDDLGSRSLHAAEQEGADTAPNTPNISDGSSAAHSVNSAETTSKGGWADNVKGNRSGNRLDPKAMLKKYGPAGGITGAIFTVAVSLMGSFGPASLLINLKETFVTNLDQQNITAEVRSQRLLAKRLTENTANSSVCAKVKRACRYEKPSNRLLQNLEKANIKALDKAGNVIERQKLLGGTRPEHYELPDGKKVSAANFRQEIYGNAQFRSAFRRAYNPRWVNWVDKVAANFLSSRGLSRSIPKSVESAKDPKAAAAAVDDATKGQAQTAEAINGLVEKEARMFAEDTARKMKKADSALIGAQMACAMAKAPGVISKVVRSYRLMQAAKVLMLFLVIADKIKAGDAQPDEVNNLATMLTATAMAGTILKPSAMDAGAMKYALLGDIGAAQQSEKLKKYIPGSGNDLLGSIISFGNSQPVKNSCSALNSTAASAAVDAVKAIKFTTPAGIVMLGVDLILFVAEKTGATEKIVGAIVGSITNLLKNIVKPEDLLKVFAGDFTKGVTNDDLGELIGMAGPNVFADIANIGGNHVLTPKQKAAFDREITIPIKLAWAKEDQTTLSPFDTSSPNTALGSIMNRFIPYTNSSSSSPFGVLSSIFSISTSAAQAFISPNSSALSITQNYCTADYSIATANVAAGPTCDVQYGIRTEDIETDSTQALSELFDNNQIDSEGEVVKDSELEGWIRTCNNANTYTLDECVVENHNQALYSIYQVDKRLVDGMDEDPASPDNTGNASTSTSTSSTTTPLGPGNGTFTDSGEVAGYANVLYNAQESERVYGSKYLAAGKCAYVTSRIWHGDQTNYGYNYAIDVWNKFPNLRHADRNPKRGALMFSQGNHPAGHVFIYLGDNKIANDGHIMDANTVEVTWKHTYLGWIDPNDLGWKNVKTKDIRWAMQLP
ncbi:MAG: hypothetical protein WAQ25_00540 [Candidatus Saccharimonas sp.]